jgi:zinc and cadmium transporter
LGVFCVSLLSLIGAATLRLTEQGLQRLIDAILPLAVGALLGDAILHLLPDALRTIGSPLKVGGYVLAGALLFLALDKALSAADSRIVSIRRQKSLPSVLEIKNQKSKIKNLPILPIGKMSIAANSVHNFVDGVLIAGTFIANPAAGTATLIAVILHEIPHEAANYGILLHANYTRQQAIVINLLVGLVAMAGAILALLVGTRSHAFIAGLIPFTAGCFIYMASADLIPSIVRKHKGKVPILVPVLVLVGFGLMGGMLFLEPK